MPRTISCLILCCLWSSAYPAETETSRAHYLANTGTVIEYGHSKIAFDPLFSEGFGIYDRVPAKVESAFLAGTAPWDDIDAVFISHFHDDHFDPALILQLLNAQATIELYAPVQATRAIRALVANPDDEVLNRVHGLAIENGAPPIDIDLGQIFIEAIRIPHAGWPRRHENVVNIVFRVTLADEATVMHFGDADPDDAHFAKNPEHWKERHTHFAMPPYWFFLSNQGRQILEERIDASHTVGVHVPTKIPDVPESRPEKLKGFDLFTRPGETRNITVTD
jgi:L-ascorbate metabolism protein UlaG (beta-lactamase superfamily)